MRLKKVLSAIIGSLVLTLGVVNVVHKAPEKVVHAADVATYTLNGTTTGGSSGYATESDITQGGKSWKVTGNTTMNPWRIGGNTLTNEKRTVYSQSAISQTICRVDLEVGTASNITVNSLTLIVASDSSFETTISTVEEDFSASSTITFNKPNSDSAWTNAYYKLIFDVTVSGSTNRFVQFKSLKFYEKHTVHFESNGGSSVDDVTVVKGNTISSPSDPTKTDYTFNGWYKEVGLVNPWNFASDTVTANTTLYAKWVSAAATMYEVTFDKNNASATGTMSNQAIEEDVSTALNSCSYTLAGYDFKGWAETSDGDVAYADGASITLTSNKTLYAKWKLTIIDLFAASNIEASLRFSYFLHEPVRKTDTIDKDLVGITPPGSYQEWSGKQENTAVYAGNSYPSSDYIQIRSDTNTSGIITTTSGGLARKVTINWNDSTADGRKIDVYGKNTSYSTAADLYDVSTQGTLLGTLTMGSSSELDIAGDYSFIGIRSNNKAIYIDSVVINWVEPTFDNISDVELLFRSNYDLSDAVGVTERGLFITSDTSWENTPVASLTGFTKKVVLTADNLTKEDFIGGINEIELTSANCSKEIVAAGYIIANGTYYFSNKKQVSIDDLILEYSEPEYGPVVNGLAEALMDAIA